MKKNPDDLLVEINALDKWHKQIDKRGDVTKKQRKPANSLQMNHKNMISCKKRVS